MLDDPTLEEKVQDIIVDICKTLYFHGYREVPVGAMMRLIGVEDATAATHDGEYFRLDEEFEALLADDELAEYNEMLDQSIPPGTVMH